MPRQAASVDANQSKIVKGLRAVGASILHLHAVGKGCPDILVGFRGENFLMEIKDGDKTPSKRKLNKGQVDWHRAWRGQVVVVNDYDEALAVIFKDRVS